MENNVKLAALRFPVTVRRIVAAKAGSGEIAGTVIEDDHVVITREQLRALALVGKSSSNMIRAMYGEKGMEVLHIGKPDRKTLTVDVTELWSGEG